MDNLEKKTAQEVPVQEQSSDEVFTVSNDFFQITLTSKGMSVMPL